MASVFVYNVFLPRVYNGFSMKAKDDGSAVSILVQKSTVKIALGKVSLVSRSYNLLFSSLYFSNFPMNSYLSVGVQTTGQCVIINDPCLKEEKHKKQRYKYYT